MNADTAIIAFGSLLILLAILGGGFQAKEINIPTIGAKTRGFCGCLGAAFVAVGIFLAPGTVKPTGYTTFNPSSAPSPAPGKAFVTFRIHNELGVGEISEQVRIILDDQMIGTLTVSTVHKQSELLATVPQEGRYSYQLSATAVFLMEDGSTREYVGTGAGYVNVAANANFSLEGDISGETWLAHLVATR